MPELRAIFHLIATTGWTAEHIDTMPAAELADWCSQAVDYHNYMHRPPG